MECFDSDGSDFELDTAQEWDTFVDTEGEEEEEFQGFQAVLFSSGKTKTKMTSSDPFFP